MSYHLLAPSQSKYFVVYSDMHSVILPVHFIPLIEIPTEGSVDGVCQLLQSHVLPLIIIQSISRALALPSLIFEQLKI